MKICKEIVLGSGTDDHRQDPFKDLIKEAANADSLFIPLTSPYAADSSARKTTTTAKEEEEEVNGVQISVVDTQALLFLLAICLLHVVVFGTYIRHRCFGRFIAQLVSAVIVVSVPWTWWDMYSQEVNKIHAEAMTAMGTDEYKRCMAADSHEDPSFTFPKRTKWGTSVSRTTLVPDTYDSCSLNLFGPSPQHTH